MNRGKRVKQINIDGNKVQIWFWSYIINLNNYQDIIPRNVVLCFLFRILLQMWSRWFKLVKRNRDISMIESSSWSLEHITSNVKRWFKLIKRSRDILTIELTSLYHVIRK